MNKRTFLEARESSMCTWERLSERFFNSVSSETLRLPLFSKEVSGESFRKTTKREHYFHFLLLSQND
jgi:hypothetical protein